MLRVWRGYHDATDPKARIYDTGMCSPELYKRLPTGVSEGLKSKRVSCAVKITIVWTGQL
jgi:hypothetical protein